MITDTTILSALLLCGQYGDPTGGILGQTLVAAQWGPGKAKESARRRAPRLIDLAVRNSPPSARGSWIDLGWETSP